MKAPRLEESFAELAPETMMRIVNSGVSPAPGGNYYHWDKLRHLDPPEGLTTEEWWLAMKWARMSHYKTLPMTDKDGESFKYVIIDEVLEKLHRIDRDAVGSIRVGDTPINKDTRDAYLVRSLFEEAIRSSQLEGASTTRQKAKRMLQSGRKPQDKHEQMIYNNFIAMNHITKRKDQPLTLEGILELHRLLTEKTLRDPAEAGRFRATDDIIVEDKRSGKTLFHPPEAVQIQERMESLCRFANEVDSSKFTHPAIRAIVLHFWLAYVHPFADGNGRTARAIFYWSMIRSGYWVCEFISISRILQSAPADYTRSYLHAETDDCDATYFIQHQFEVITKALDELYEYLQRKNSERRSVMKLIKDSPQLGKALNYRQVALLDDAMQRPNHNYTFNTHRDRHSVSYQTARNDLLGLRDLGLLREYLIGRTFYFDVPDDIHDLIEEFNQKNVSRS